MLASSSSVFPNLSPGAAYCAGASPYPGDAAAVGFGRRPRLYGGELQPRYSNGEAIRGMVFKLGIVSSTWRLWTLSPGATRNAPGLLLSDNVGLWLRRRAGSAWKLLAAK